MKACKECHLLTNRDICPFCSLPTSEYWQGYLIVIDPEKSRIAKKMNIKMPGKYALKVR
jgi:DNA-directed RNA polymerase subunit E"